MARLFILALLSFVATSVFAELLLSCSGNDYYASQYTCFDEDFLCPINNGDRTVRCAEACYSLSQYSCATDTLEPYLPNGVNPDQPCGSEIFDPSTSLCLDRYFVCPIVNGTAYFNCEDGCYDPTQYGCALGQLYPVGTVPPTCVPQYSDPNNCDYYGCVQEPCCAGLWDGADRCRPL
ncbi:hypothetical protein FB45DRAFT_1004870 [Roridomyces roridus]|uniref:Endo-1,3(4)-beta-glucanase 1 carbohydrate binding domain-containing protein n=1 Tax=Roridomyces roridus TaxID=1738132 RepID=A0AAD7FM77_9AGAR|nr:hypothetical protein FB45DRAFT_1004870 [Roridomyces roridus]